MNILLRILNPFQIVLVVIWTVVSALTGMILVAITWNRNFAHYMTGRVIYSPMMMLLTGVWVKTTGRENVPKDRTCIYVANHESLFDIVVLVRAVPVALFFIAKMELKKVPFVGWYMRALGMIFVDRGNREQAVQSMKKAAMDIREGKNIISFPEGTRSKDGKLKVFKRGAFILAKEGGIDLVPIGIIGAGKIIPSGSFSIRPGVVYVHIGKPILMSEHRDKSVEELANEARERVKALIEA